MTTIKDIYSGGQRLMEQIIRKEMNDQGHYLTGTMDASLDAKVTKKGRENDLVGYAADYARYVNDGVPAASASFKQMPFLIKYFEARGYPYYSGSGGLNAVSLAAMTIKKWMKEGMSTQASKRFSKTGSRQQMIENAIAGNESRIDEYMGNAFDFSVDEHYHETKSETI